MHLLTSSRSFCLAFSAASTSDPVLGIKQERKISATNLRRQLLCGTSRFLSDISGDLVEIIILKADALSVCEKKQIGRAHV